MQPRAESAALHFCTSLGKSHLSFFHALAMALGGKYFISAWITCIREYSSLKNCAGRESGTGGEEWKRRGGARHAPLCCPNIAPVVETAVLPWYLGCPNSLFMSPNECVHIPTGL